MYVGNYIINENCERILRVLPRHWGYTNRWEFFAGTYPPIAEPLPRIVDNAEICVFYYIFGRVEHPIFEQNVHIYAKEAVYGYNQLLQHTDIGECGRVRFFIDSRFEDVICPYFKVACLEDLVIPVDVVSHVKHEDSLFHLAPFSSYFNFFKHPDVQACRYALKLDTKIMMLNVDALPHFSFRELCEKLDRERSGLFGHINPTDFHVLEDWMCRGYPTSETDIAYLHDAIETSVGDWKPDRHMSGQCVGMKNGGVDARNVLAFYERYGDRISHDEGFLLFFLAQNPDLEVIDIQKRSEYFASEDIKASEFAIKPLAFADGTAMFERSGHHLLDFHRRNEGYQQIDHLTSGLESVWKFYDETEGVIEVDGTEARYLHSQ